MKSLILAFTLSVASWPGSGCFDDSFTGVSEIIGVYTGRTPCGDYFRDLLKIPKATDCEMIRWELSLSRDAKTGAPRHFHLKYNYGMNQPNTEDFTGGGNPSEIHGVWKLSRGTKTNSNAVVYVLEADHSSKQMSLVLLNENVMHLLYSDGGLMIRNGGWSYTLYKIK